jgi:hypothetical protein
MTQAAARTFALRGAWCCIHFDRHVCLRKGVIRDQMTRLKIVIP